MYVTHGQNRKESDSSSSLLGCGHADGDDAPELRRFCVQWYISTVSSSFMVPDSQSSFLAVSAVSQARTGTPGLPRLDSAPQANSLPDDTLVFEVERAVLDTLRRPSWAEALASHVTP